MTDDQQYRKKKYMNAWGSDLWNNNWMVYVSCMAVESGHRGHFVIDEKTVLSKNIL